MDYCIAKGCYCDIETKAEINPMDVFEREAKELMEYAKKQFDDFYLDDSIGCEHGYNAGIFSTAIFFKEMLENCRQVKLSRSSMVHPFRAMNAGHFVWSKFWIEEDDE